MVDHAFYLVFPIFFFFNFVLFLPLVRYVSVAFCRSHLPMREHGLHTKLEYILPVRAWADRVLISHVEFCCWWITFASVECVHFNTLRVKVCWDGDFVFLFPLSCSSLGPNSKEHLGACFCRLHRTSVKLMGI